MQPTALELERQQRREIAEIRRGEKAYQEAMLVKDPSSLPSGKRLMREIIPALTAAIAAHQDECLGAIKRPGGKRMPYLWAIQAVTAETQAFLTLDAALRAEIGNAADDRSLHLTAIAARLGRAVREHAEVKELADRDGRDVLTELKKKFKAVNRMTWSRWKVKAGALKQPWSAEVIVHLGAALLAKLVEVAPAHFQTNHRRKPGGRTQLFFTLTDQSRAVVDDVEQRRAIAMPHFMPMVIKPLDWRYSGVSLSGMTPGENGQTTMHRGRLEGGYVVHRLNFVRTGREDHTKALPSAVSALDLAAVNHLQSTGWAINRWLYDVMSEAWVNELRLGKLETGEMEPHVSLSDEVFEALTKEARGEHCRKRLAVHRANAKRRGRFNQIVDYLAVARELRDERVFYYPHVCDFRHRVYPVPVRGPHPQGDDLAKSLLHFAEGKPLGETGEFWLRVHTANCAGKDKLTLEERIEWTFTNSTQLMTYATDPFTYQGWTSTENPWCFLAACNELKRMSELAESSQFVSHLPIALDGSCNGIQHLSAMGLDPIGAEATNLRPGPRQDIYALVAQRVTTRVATDAATTPSKDTALPWLGKVDRKTVKRAVMTTPYGVTVRGIRDQLLADELVPGNEGKLADYMRDCICEALSGTVVAAKDIMGWLQDCAKHLGKAGLPLRWETPSGSSCEQAYHTTTATVVRTLCGQLTLLQEDAKATLKPSKQALASAPNIIHSFDAAHLTMTIMAGAERGISHWQCIHDSYATHAANTQTLSAVLREQFVEIYRTDWLQRLYQGFKAYAPNVKINPPPARGGFDIEEVLSSEFFFS